MSILIKIEGERVILKLVAEEPGFNVDAPEYEVLPGGSLGGISYDEFVAHGPGEMMISVNGAPVPIDDDSVMIVVEDDPDMEPVVEAVHKNSLLFWLRKYEERFGGTVELSEFNTEADCVEEIKAALETGEPIPAA